jgi:2'-5' RNA ligase
MPSFRGFIAVDIPANKKIQEIEKEIKQTNPNIKLVETENIHITLKFLGDVQETLIDNIEQIITSAIQGVQPFSVKLQHTGVFPNVNYIKIIWIGIYDNGILSTITSKLEDQLESLGFPKEQRGFSPHLTIGRVKTAEHKEKLLQIIRKYEQEEFGDLIIDRVLLKKSELTPKGPIYSNLKEIILK